MSHSVFKRQVGTRDIVIETGRLAQQANGSVLMQTGDSAVLVTATMSKPREGIDFFPLTIDFEERLYARGKIPGNFFRREGRPSFDAILTDRLTDRPLRPLFPKGFRNEVQIIATALSADQESPLDMLVLNGASAALSMSDIPFGGPIGATRVGFVDGEYVINPTYQQLAGSQLDLVVAGSRDGVMMMEAGASELSEAQVLKAIQLAQDANLEIIALQEEIVSELGVEKVGFTTGGVSPEAVEQASGIIGDGIARALDESNGKADQAERLDAVKATLAEQMDDEVKDAFEAVLEREFRARILDQGKRPDGRGVKDLRELSADTGILPRTHGTGLFQRGETQVLGVATLGSSGDVQRLDNLSPNDSKRFMLHYNFPPFSTGETGRVGSPGRREIGHGALAERALLPVIPSEEDFPYVIRLVADVLSSNGSTSQASVCACTLALMDAGVPITRPVAGISVGLVTGDDGRFAILTDIQGMEDHFGDMDFKVAGTSEGITAIQLDIKIGFIGWDVIEATLEQAKDARMEILEVMLGAIEAPRDDLSEFAPRMTRISIPISKIGAVIGPGGKTIRAIVEETKATVDIADDGTVTIGSSDADASKRAVAIIEGLTKEAKVGDKFTGKVVRIMNFGAFVEILPGTDGMVHISELSDRHVPTVEDVVALGDEIEVEVIGVDHSGRIALSRRSLLQGGDQDGGSDSDGPPRDGGGDSRGGQGGYRDRPPQGGGSRSDPPRDRDRGPRR
jgi:polyribonucleotide nucleotidyltransferase